jgi:hypothetical protein
LTRIQTQNLQEGAVTTAILSNTATAAFATSASVAEFASALAPKVSSVNVANSAFAVLDDTAVNVGGGYIVVTGTNFAEGVTVLIDTTSATSVSRINSTTLRVQVPPKSAASYNLFVVNPDGGTGIRVAGITYSGTPTWVTASPLTGQDANVAFNINFSATSATSYAVANGSTLPAGTALLANGYFYGAVSVEVNTTYSFDVVATDAELQDSSKTFGITITVKPPRLLYAVGNFSYAGTAGYNNAHFGTFQTPTQIVNTTDWSEITVSGQSAFGVKQNGSLWVWGKNGTGQLGLNLRSDESGPPYGVSSPTQVGSGTNWYKVFSSGSSGTARNTFALKTDGTLWGWGNNGYSGGSNLATNNGSGSFRRSSPVQVGTDTNWSDVLSLSNSNLAIRTNGTLWGWGGNSYGNLGLNVTTGYSASSPVQIGALTNWSKFLKTSGESSHQSRAIKTDGTLWVIGGYGHTINQGIFTSTKSSPVQYGTDSDWATGAITSDGASMIAIKTNGTMWALIGGNGAGELGLNNVIGRSSPVQIGSGTNWSKVFGSYDNFFAIKTDGTLWSWGGGYSYLGLGDQGANSYRSSPTQIGSLTGWASVSTVYARHMFLRDQL